MDTPDRHGCYTTTYIDDIGVRLVLTISADSLQLLCHGRCLGPVFRNVWNVWMMRLIACCFVQLTCAQNHWILHMHSSIQYNTNTIQYKIYRTLTSHIGCESGARIVFKWHKIHRTLQISTLIFKNFLGANPLSSLSGVRPTTFLLRVQPQLPLWNLWLRGEQLCRSYMWNRITLK